MEITPSVVALQKHHSLYEWLEYATQSVITIVVLCLLVMVVLFLYKRFFESKSEKKL